MPIVKTAVLCWLLVTNLGVPDHVARPTGFRLTLVRPVCDAPPGDFDPPVLLTIHSVGIDVNGISIGERSLGSFFESVYRTRFAKVLYVMADKQISYQRFMMTVDAVYRQFKQVILVTKPFARNANILSCVLSIVCALKPSSNFAKCSTSYSLEDR